MGTGWRRSRVVLAVFVLAASPLVAKEVKIPDLSGNWKFNEELTLRLQQSARQEAGQGSRGRGGQDGEPGGRGGGRRGGVPRRGGGGGFPPAGGEAQRPGEGQGGEADRAPIPGSEGPDGVVTIAWAAPQLTFTYPGDRKRVLYTDGRKVTESRPGGGKTKIRARWQDDNLEVVTETPDGLTRTEIYEISNDGKRLFVIVGVEGRGPRPRELRRVYDRVEPSPPPPLPSPTPPPGEG